MSNDNRIIELLADRVKGQHELVEGQRELVQGQDKLVQRVERLEQSQMKTNMVLQEHTLAISKLADKLEVTIDLVRRVSKLEGAVFH